MKKRLLMMDIKNKTQKELEDLSVQIREIIIDTVSKNGGHLASNLGDVELTLAIHHCFDVEKDHIIFDVGHQAYTHKLITDRFDSFEGLRKKEGISGFTKKDESSYDAFGAGHSGTSISAAIGFAEADKLNKTDSWSIAVIGDGSFTNGMVYEALNNCRDKDIKLLIVLNDNEMSISENVGGLSRYFSRLRNSKKYFNFKHNTKKIFGSIPLIGKPLIHIFSKIRDFLKRLILKSNIFEDLGLDYLGPLDGNNLKDLIRVFEEAKTKKSAVVVHVCTKKGLGYPPAESNPELYHSASPFDKETGIIRSEKETFSSVFGKTLTEMAKENSDIVAITAAMSAGTGLDIFKKTFPERFFDVGIAESHAMTFASGLSAAGKYPVFAVYSTFFQRVFDQLFHDDVLQRLKLTICLDRAGLVEGDGQTHQGIFDIPLCSSLPDIDIYSPETFSELERCLKNAPQNDRTNIIRYPKGEEKRYDHSSFTDHIDYSILKEEGTGKKKLLLITFGRVTEISFHAYKELKDDYDIAILKLIKIYPLDNDLIVSLVKDSDAVIVVEESIKNGGIVEKIGTLIAESGIIVPFKIIAIENKIPGVGTIPELYKEFGFTKENIKDSFKELLHFE